MSRIGFVGLGSQGGPMARRITDAGLAVSLWARRPEALDPFLTGNVNIAGSLRELGAACDILCVCVVADADVESVLRGDQGALAGMPPGGLVAVHSTVHPQTMLNLQRDFPQIAFVDAPVSGGGPRAAEGTLFVMVGGDPAAVERCRPVFDTYSRTVVHLGPLGVGQQAKLLNNALFTAQLGLVADVFSLARSQGIDPAALGQVLADGSGRSYAAEVLANAGYQLEPLGSLAGPLLAKDVRILADLLAPTTGAVIDGAGRALAGMGIDRAPSAPTGKVV